MCNPFNNPIKHLIIILSVITFKRGPKMRSIFSVIIVLIVIQMTLCSNGEELLNERAVRMKRSAQESGNAAKTGMPCSF